MPSEPLLQPILEDVDLEAQHDNLLELETYKHFTADDWCKCCKWLLFFAILIAIVCFLLYTLFYSLQK